MKTLSPLLNPEIISYGLKIPIKFKYNESENIGKLPLRSLLKDYNADSLISKEKLGFNVNSLNIFKYYGQNICKEFFDNSLIIEDGWIDIECDSYYVHLTCKV